MPRVDGGISVNSGGDPFERTVVVKCIDFGFLIIHFGFKCCDFLFKLCNALFYAGDVSVKSPKINILANPLSDFGEVFFFFSGKPANRKNRLSVWYLKS